MFDHVGRQIKGLAKAVTWVGIIFSAVVGIVMMTAGGIFVLYGFVVIGMGAFLSWVASLALYGFGQLVENSDILARKAKAPDMNVPGQPVSGDSVPLPSDPAEPPEDKSAL